MKNDPQVENEDVTVVTPWEVKTKDKSSINYDHVIKQFGCKKFEYSFIEELEKLSGKKAHRFLKRGLAFAHRDFDKILDCIKRNEKFYLYTGRGPSSESMHIGHSIPFLLCQYLQEAFGCPLVIQITDDEKFIFKEKIALEDSISYGEKNIKDIIAFGFDPELTFIFSNYNQHHVFYENVLKISKVTKLKEVKPVFGFEDNSNIGMIAFPAYQIAPAFASSFPYLKKNMTCFVPAAIDQDPYFRLARDKAAILGETKPASVYVTLLPDLKGPDKKMSSTAAL